MRYCKNIANLFLWKYLIMPIDNDREPCRELWWPQCWNQLVGYFDVYLHTRNQLHLQLLFWDTGKTLQTYYFGNFKNAWLSPSKIIVSICRKLSYHIYLLTKNQLHHSFLFLHIFLELLQRCYKFVIVGIFRHVWLCTPKVMLSTCKNFCVYLQAKIQLHPLHISGDIAKICKLLILGTFKHARLHPPKIGSTCNKLNHSLLSWDTTFHRILQFDWLDRILAHNSRIRTSLDMGLAVKY